MTTAFYNIIESLRTHFQGDVLVSEITEGSIYKVDLSKQTLFPLIHIMVNSATFDEASTITFNVSILAIGIVDVNKDETTDRFKGNDNTQDVLNTTLSILNRCFKQAKSGTLFDSKIQVEGSASCEPFEERFENNLAGWTMTLDLVTPNGMTIC